MWYTQGMPTTEQLAYAAGLVDGEGSIMLVKKGRLKGGLLYRELRVEVANTDLRMITWLIRVFDGAITVCKRPADARRKDYYVWRLTGWRARDFIEKVHPFLVTKKKHVEAVRLFQASVSVSGHALTEAQRAGKAESIQMLSQLNRRGRVVDANADRALDQA